MSFLFKGRQWGYSSADREHAQHVQSSGRVQSLEPQKQVTEVHTCPQHWEVQTGGSEIQGQSQLDSLD